MKALTTRNSKFYIVGFVLFIFLAAMGDWKTVNVALGALPKVLSLGVIGITFFYMLLTGDIKKMKVYSSFGLMYMSIITGIILISIVIWIVDLQKINFIMTGMSKMSFQFINIIILICGVYLFEERAPIYTFYGIALANITIIMIGALQYGVGVAISDIINNIITGGDAIEYSHFIRAIEIHDITFVMGLYVIYFLLFCKEEKRRFIYAGVAMFLFMAGLKRIALLSVAMAMVFAVFCRLLNSEWKKRILTIVSVCIVGFCFFYVVIINSGAFTAFLEEHDIDLMGREKIYDFISNYYEISPTYMGKGYEFCVRLLRDMKGTVDQVVDITMVHNDILKMYVELGFWGFLCWSTGYYVYQTHWFITRCNANTAVCFMTMNLYMLISYMTDNTIFYYWSSMVLRMIPMAFFFAEMKKENHEEGRLSSLLEQGGY